MSMIQRAREEVSRRYRRHGTFSRSLDRLNRMPLLKAFTDRFPEAPTFATREAMWDHLAGAYAGPIAFLEFGVHEGHSLLHWARVNIDPASRFVGFDTFCGLPETWNRFYEKGHFDTEGRTPKTSDPRVQFVAGLFQQTLDGFLEQFDARTRRIVLHIDCDLYGSALYCLTKLDRRIASGTLLIFDEFGDVQHEFRAFADWCASYRREARIIATHDDHFTVALEVL